MKLPNGETWKNLVTEEKSRIATTVADYRGNYKYNLLDAHMRRFNAEVPVFAQWDDHEVANDWWPGQTRRRLCQHQCVAARSARPWRVFCEYMPVRQTQAESERIYRKIPYGPLLDVFVIDMRSYRGPNTTTSAGERRKLHLGRPQLEWLERPRRVTRSVEGDRSRHAARPASPRGKMRKAAQSKTPPMETAQPSAANTRLRNWLLKE